jgi:hypothetical protein
MSTAIDFSCSDLGLARRYLSDYWDGHRVEFNGRELHGGQWVHPYGFVSKSEVKEFDSWLLSSIIRWMNGEARELAEDSRKQTFDGDPIVAVETIELLESVDTAKRVLIAVKGIS